MAAEVEKVEVSVVMPCLNEADTLATCIGKAQAAMRTHGIDGEVVVADNGSVDGSPEIARAMDARVVDVAEKGYGFALMAGIAAARGDYVVMGDADDSYDFLEVPKFVEKLREGSSLVMGCRLPAGGGKVDVGAMPWLHQRFGNPVLTWLVRRWFGATIHDVYCGMRGFTKKLCDRLDLRCTGMEFATEMVIKSTMYAETIAEVPITLHVDGRKAHKPHLRTFADGWRTLRFFLMYSPRRLFLAPGAAMIVLGMLGYALALPGVTIGSATLGAHTLLFASLAVIAGYQCIVFGLLTRIFATTEGLFPEDPRLWWWFKIVDLERGLLVGFAALAFGGVLLLASVNRWRHAHFGPLDYVATMRLVVPGATLAVLGLQTVLASFFISILGLRRHPGWAPVSDAPGPLSERRDSTSGPRPEARRRG